MGKILGSWSGMRKYLEQDMIANTLQGRIRYGCTRYVGMETCHIFEVCIDGVESRKGKPRSDMPWFEKDNMIQVY